jgi:hypothetical protein
MASVKHDIVGFEFPEPVGTFVSISNKPIRLASSGWRTCVPEMILRDLPVSKAAELINVHDFTEEGVPEWTEESVIRHVRTGGDNPEDARVFWRPQGVTIEDDDLIMSATQLVLHEFIEQEWMIQLSQECEEIWFDYYRGAPDDTPSCGIIESVDEENFVDFEETGVEPGHVI